MIKTKFDKRVHGIFRWMTRGILISRTNKIRLGKLCYTHPSIENNTRYKNYRNLYNTVVRGAKKLFYERELKKAQSNLKKTWNLLKNVLNKPTSKSNNIESLNIDGVSISDPKTMANKLNSYFTNVARQIAEQIPPTDRPPDDDNLLNDIPLLKFAENPVTCSEIIETLRLLQPKKSEDIDGVSMFLLKKIAFQLANPLRHIINLSFENAIVPTQLKIAKIVPIFKSGDTESMDNYRPISLLNSFSKIFEKIVCSRLVIFLENNNILSPSQFGFRSKHSTVHPMVKLTNFVSEALNKKEHAIAIFCDLRKAFDTCNYQILLKKLEKIGIRGKTLEWFKSYLSERKQFVVIDGVSSELLDIDIGVPQGSILGPILFLIYINDLPLCTSLLMLLFADDTTILASGKNIDDLIAYVNDEFKKIVYFFRCNKLSLHPLKTQFILYSNSNEVKNK